MQKTPFHWLWLPTLIVTVITIPILLFLPHKKPAPSPVDHIPAPATHVDHTALMTGPYDSPQAVTERCLECHKEAGKQIMHSNHWTWDHEPVNVPGRKHPVAGGKKNVVNNFCIGIAGNWNKCSSCHVGYGWKDNSFDFSNSSNIDCLVCHEQTGAYVKGNAGIPVEGVDLLASAQSVASPKRANCGGCHFKGGGGDAVKHGDLDTSLLNPADSVDVHMGKHDMQCIDCHQTSNHHISGSGLSVSMDNSNAISCTNCHEPNLHSDERINQHTKSVACQTCHIPEVATRIATKTHWDWSKAGDDQREENHEYKKIKGEFVYEENLQPDYLWFDGTAERHLFGDKINPTEITKLNNPNGDINNPKAKIFPFKAHYAKQIYDSEYNHLLQPKTVGKTGYWTTFDWDSAARQGSNLSGLAYSGHYDFADTVMYWPQTHMVQAAASALQCRDCHNETANDKPGRLDWKALGYPGDPIRWGARNIGGQP